MFLAKPGEYSPCGMFNFKHLILFIVTISGIVFATKRTKIKEKKDIKRIIQIVTVIIWVLEILKIIFDFAVGDGKNINKVVPLYYCSLLLYAGLLSSIGKGVIQRIGDVFLATGGIIGGLVFLIMPTTSLPEYPMFHFISLHSFLYHGIMIYLGVIINKFKYIELKMSDIKYYSVLILIICIGAYIINSKCGSNLMFISQDFPKNPITIIYHLTGKLFPIVMSLAQMTLPFLLVYGIVNIKNKYFHTNGLLKLKGEWIKYANKWKIYFEQTRIK